MNNRIEIKFVINGQLVSHRVKPGRLLIDLIRDELKLKGTKPGCMEGECGACSVIIDGDVINSCMYLAINVDGKEVITIEGLGSIDNPLDTIQEKMLVHGAVQCGFCTSGMVLTIKAYNDKMKALGKIPTREELKKSLEGNLCRCTGYVKIIDAAEAIYED